MTDREKVIKGLSCCAKWMEGTDADACDNCPYYHSQFNYYDNDCVVALNNDAIALLKEREPTEPVLDETTKRFYRCGACGEYVGFIDSDPGDPNEQDCFCRNCGRAVKWP